MPSYSTLARLEDILLLSLQAGALAPGSNMSKRTQCVLSVRWEVGLIQLQRPSDFPAVLTVSSQHIWSLITDKFNSAFQTLPSCDLNPNDFVVTLVLFLSQVPCLALESVQQLVLIALVVS